MYAAMFPVPFRRGRPAHPEVQGKSRPAEKELRIKKVDQTAHFLSSISIKFLDIIAPFHDKCKHFI